ncbi:MAG: ABC transporter ATP-binding protein, partial [Marivirga sp.]|nr:ABC transporter ATP-binding protein [Marivirga sp.]
MNHQQNKPLIELHNVTKSYPVASGTFKALKDVSLKIESRKLVAITGKSGSGKS